MLYCPCTRHSPSSLDLWTKCPVTGEYLLDIERTLESRSRQHGNSHGTVIRLLESGRMDDVIGYLMYLMYPASLVLGTLWNSESTPTEYYDRPLKAHLRPDVPTKDTRKLDHDDDKAKR